MHLSHGNYSIQEDLRESQPNVTMRSLNLRNRISRYLDIERPSSTGPVDFEIQALGDDTSIIQLRALPPKKGLLSPQERIAELSEEIRQLTCELEYYQNLTGDVLLRIMPIVHFHSSGLFSMVQKCNASVEQAFAQHEHSQVHSWQGHPQQEQPGMDVKRRRFTHEAIRSACSKAR